MPRPLALALLTLVALPAGTRAQYGAKAEVERPIPATAEEDPSASGTEIPVEHEGTVHQSVQDVTHEVPGAVPIQSGTYASYSGLSLRGAELDHTSVLLGELPLGGPDFGGFDLSLIPLFALERIEVYRGGAPVWLGGGAIGGVLRLVPRSEPTPVVGARVVGGSFGTYGVDAFASAGRPGLSSFVTAGVRGTQGNYPYLSNILTLDPSDDEQRVRRNAHSLEGHGMAHVAVDALGGRLEMVGLGMSRQDGIPGPASAPAFHAQRHHTRALGTVGWTRRKTTGRLPHRVQLAVGGGYARNQFTDRFNEIGLSRNGQVTDDRIGQVFSRAASTLELASFLDVTALATVRRDAYRPDDRSATSMQPDWERLTTAVSAEAKIHGTLGDVRLELRPSTRVAFSRARLQSASSGTPDAPTDDELVPTARLGAVVAPVPWLAVSGSVATGKRLPSVLELFGDRNALKPNPELEPESSLAFDAGLVAEGAQGPVRGSAELRYFDLRIDDLIVYMPGAQFTATPLNLGRGHIRGVEAGARGWIGSILELGGTLTWLDTDDGRGRELPSRPSLQAQARPALHLAPWLDTDWLSDVVFHVGVIHRSSFFPKPSNLEEYPARTWIAPGLRFELFAGAVSASLVVHDVLDDRGFDWLNYPLPGRRVLASVTYRKDL
ncbi:MAG: TonB-dependent receptor plug domain-containing protein [Myxococcota bacterium]